MYWNINMITTLTSKEFNRDASRAKQIAEAGPVFITDRGKPAHVLLTMAEFKRLNASKQTIADLLAMPDSADAELALVISADIGIAADFS